MWTIHSEEFLHGRGMRFAVHRENQPAVLGDVLTGLKSDAAFRSRFNDELASAPYAAFRWETPAATRSTLNRPFEFVLLDSPGLVRRSEPEAFAEHFTPAPTGGVVTFANLGGDAILVVPTPLGPPPAYGHLAAFVREAPAPQRDALWRAVAEAMASRVNSRPVWLSTAGAGVAWLHVRLDDRPKYYSHAPYRQLASAG
jgi:hypothetical protein